jgi:hypothetical protein
MLQTYTVFTCTNIRWTTFAQLWWQFADS